eukprot:gene4083-2931_t
MRLKDERDTPASEKTEGHDSGDAHYSGFQNFPQNYPYYDLIYLLFCTANDSGVLCLREEYRLRLFTNKRLSSCMFLFCFCFPRGSNKRKK